MTATIVYKGKLRCEAVHLMSQSVIETDAPTDNRGNGERFSPTDLTATSLGLCLITTIGIKAMDMGLNLDGSSLEVTKHMSKEAPRRIVQVDVVVKFSGDTLSSHDQQLMENVGRACPVARSLHPDVVQNIQYHWPS